MKLPVNNLSQNQSDCNIYNELHDIDQLRRVIAQNIWNQSLNFIVKIIPDLKIEYLGNE